MWRGMVSERAEGNESDLWWVGCGVGMSRPALEYVECVVAVWAL